MTSDLAVTFAAVVFDIGGVLERNPRTGWEARWGVDLGLDTAQLRNRLRPIWSRGDVGALSLTEIERRTADVLQLDPPRLRALMDDHWTEYIGTLNERLTRYFKGLRPRYRTGIPQ